MPTTCEIEFENNPSKVIYAGQLLRGTVKLQVTSVKPVRGVYIRLCGRAYSNWTEGYGKNEEDYTDEEEILNEKSYLVGGETGEHRILPGTYNYSFQCMLPAGLPTSFDGEHGHIRYTARVVLDIPNWIDKTIKVPFTVIKEANLNADPSLREPVTVEKEKHFFYCCLLFCFLTQPVKMRAKTSVGGYTPGQVINLEFSAKNESHQPVLKFIVRLIKKITYCKYSNSSVLYVSKVEEICITKQDIQGCGVDLEKTTHVNIEVPPTPPTDSSSCKIIKVEYFIRINGTVPGCNHDPILYLPIKIGSYPIQDETQNVISQQPSAPPASEQSGDEPQLPSAPFPFSDDDPPTYEEAMLSKNKKGNNFKPKYPMFKRTTSYSNQ